MRQSVIVAQALAISPGRTKLLAFAIAAAFAGLASGLFTAVVGFIDPTEFDISASLRQITFIVVGGLGSVLGSVVGALILTLLPEALLMRTYLEKANEAGKEIKDVAQKWSWFEEFYKKCKPNKENLARVYNGEDLEQKFCEWVLNDQLPQAADVRKLYDCLEDKKAMALLDKGSSIDKAHEVVAANRPELTSKLWKQIEDVTDMLNNTPISEIEALRGGDDAKVEMITDLLQSVKRIMTEAKLKA